MARQKVVSAKCPKFSNWQGGKRYTEAFLLHFSIKILVKFLKVGGNCPHIPPRGHAASRNRHISIQDFSKFHLF